MIKMKNTTSTSGEAKQISVKHIVIISDIIVLVILFFALKKLNLFSSFLGEIIMIIGVFALLIIWIKLFSHT